MPTTARTTSSSSRSTIFTVAGLVIVLLAALLALVIAPKLTQLPGDFESIVDYDGSSAQLDSATLKLGQATDVTAQRVVKVEQTDGSTAIISSVSTANLPSGKSVTDKRFAVDRTDYHQIEDADDVDDQQGGMVISHVRHPSKKGFTVYDGTTDTAQPVAYKNTEEIKGRQTYYFEGTSTSPVTAEATLETLRKSVGESMGTDGTYAPAATVQTFVASLPGENGDKLRAALAATGAEVPLNYISTNTTKVWIDTTMGSPIKTGQKQIITLYADLNGTPHPLLELSSLTLESDDASVTRLADTASSNASKIKLVQTYAPIGLAVIGLVLLAIGVVGARGSKTKADEPTASHSA